MSTPGRNRRSRWTDALLAACGLFVLTVFLMIATAFNPKGAVLARFFDLHGITLLALEVGTILVVAIIVLVAERRSARRQTQEPRADSLPSDFRESEVLESRGGGTSPADDI